MAIEVAVIGARIFRWRFGVTVVRRFRRRFSYQEDRKSTRLNSSHLVISYAVFCLKKKKKTHMIIPYRFLQSQKTPSFCILRLKRIMRLHLYYASFTSIVYVIGIDRLYNSSCLSFT